MSDIKYQISSIKYQVSVVKYQLSSIKLQVSHCKYQDARGIKREQVIAILKLFCYLLTYLPPLRVLEELSLLKIDQFGPLSDPAGPFLTKGALKLASQGPIGGTFWAP